MKKKILIVDDQPDFGEMIKVNLEEDGMYEVDAVLNAIEGLKRVQAEKYDLIFLDVLMPRMEGHEALLEIKKLTDVPVVIMSAFLPEHKKSEIMDAGAFTCLEKPIKLDLFLETIEKALAPKEE